MRSPRRWRVDARDRLCRRREHRRHAGAAAAPGALDGALVLRRHRASCGQSAAVVTGVRAARGDWIATLGRRRAERPGRHPGAARAGPGCGTAPAAGGRAPARSGGTAGRSGSRRRIANGVRAALLRDETPDTGCGLKLFRRAAFLELPHFDHMHRYLPALFIRAGRAGGVGAGEPPAAHARALELRDAGPALGRAVRPCGRVLAAAAVAAAGGRSSRERCVAGAWRAGAAAGRAGGRRAGAAAAGAGGGDSRRRGRRGRRRSCWLGAAACARRACRGRWWPMRAGSPSGSGRQRAGAGWRSWLACAADFWWARLLARRWAMRLLRSSGGRLARLERFLAANAFTATLTLRLLPVGSNLALNLLAGVSAVAAGRSWLASVLGYRAADRGVRAARRRGAGVRKARRSGWRRCCSRSPWALGVVLLRRRPVPA